MKFVPAHTRFRVIALGAPVPPYPGYPLDPPFRSRFQARFVDPVGAMMALAGPHSSATSSAPEALSPARVDNPAHTDDGGLYERLRQVILATQYASEAHSSLDSSARSTLPAFPQTALAKLRALLTAFPAPALSPVLLARLVIAIHPMLAHAQFVAWALLSKQLEEAGVGVLGSPAGSQEDASEDEEGVGLLGYKLVRIERSGERTTNLTFASPSGTTLSMDVPPRPPPHHPLPIPENPDLGFLPTPRFVGLLTSMLQVHAVGYDMSLVPPSLPGASCSTSTLARVFARVLGYDAEEWGMYKELGGRELVMRRVVEQGGATRWEPR